MSSLQSVYNVLRQRFEALPANDRRALLIMVVAVGLTVIYLSLSMSREFQQRAQERFMDFYEDNRWIALNLPQIRNLANTASSSNAGSANASDASLINRATTSAKPYGVVFKRFQPEGETGLRLWIEGVEFDQLIRWIGALDKQQIQLDQLDIDKQDEHPGVVDARVLLSLKP